jgi:hypothetical protein
VLLDDSLAVLSLSPFRKHRLLQSLVMWNTANVLQVQISPFIEND